MYFRKCLSIEFRGFRAPMGNKHIRQKMNQTSPLYFLCPSNVSSNLIDEYIDSIIQESFKS